jgi:hypothetical protein
MTFTYNNSVPASANNPSVDQPNMLINTQSVNSILGVDHVSFNAVDGGTHQQVTFSSENTPVAQTDPSSVLYTTPGIASAIADIQFVNQNATFPINFIRAWASCTTIGISAPQSFNVTSVTPAGAGTYNVVLPANVVTGTNYGVIGSAANNATSGVWFTYTITSATTFTIYMFSQGLVPPSSFNFMVIQL